MGDETEWQKFYETDDNPFKKRVVSRPLFVEEEEEEEQPEGPRPQPVITTVKPQPATKKTKENAGYRPAAPKNRSDQPILIKPLYRIGLSDSHPRLEYQARTQSWTEPAYFTQQYKAAMNLNKEPGHVCTNLDVFSVPPGTLTEADLDCDDIFLAELSPGSPYFNPIFMQPADLAEFRKTGSLDLLRRVYMSHDTYSEESDEREKRQLAIGAGIGVGVLAKAAMDRVLGWMGYHTSTGAEIKKINANQDHVEEIATHVEHVEALAGTLTTLTRVVRKEEGYMSYLLLLVGRLELLFSKYEEAVRGLELLALHHRASPQLVKPSLLYAEVARLEDQLVTKGYMMLVRTESDVWKCQTSYAINTSLQVTVLIHIPVARKDSYRTMYQYETTPMSTDGFAHHVLVYPKETIVSVDKRSRQIGPMTKETLEKCTQVGLGPRFCPADSFEKITPEPTCLIALYENRNTDIVATCPIVYMEEAQLHVAKLSTHHFSVYLPHEAFGRVSCRDEFLGSFKMEAGLSEVQLNPMCQYQSAGFTLMPQVDVAVRELRFDKIALDLEPLRNLSEPVSWAVSVGKIPLQVKDAGPSLQDVVARWDHSKLQAKETMDIMTWAGLIVGSVLGVICFVTISKWCISCKSREKYRETLKENIKQYIREELATGNWRELQELNPTPLVAETSYITMSEAAGET